MIKAFIYRIKYRKFKKRRAVMCEGCAFKTGSKERRDRRGWQELLRTLTHGDVFLCHETMFNMTPFKKRYANYDKRRDKDGQPCTPEGGHALCAGYIALFKERHHKHDGNKFQ